MSEDNNKDHGYTRETAESRFAVNKGDQPPAHSDDIIMNLAASAVGIFENGDKDSVSIAMEATTNTQTGAKCYHFAMVGAVPAEAALALISETFQAMVDDLNKLRESEGLPEHKNT